MGCSKLIVGFCGVLIVCLVIAIIVALIVYPFYSPAIDEDCYYLAGEVLINAPTVCKNVSGDYMVQIVSSTADNYTSYQVTNLDSVEKELRTLQFDFKGYASTYEYTSGEFYMNDENSVLSFDINLNFTGNIYVFNLAQIRCYNNNSYCGCLYREDDTNNAKVNLAGKMEFVGIVLKILDPEQSKSKAFHITGSTTNSIYKLNEKNSKICKGNCSFSDSNGNYSIIVDNVGITESYEQSVMIGIPVFNEALEDYLIGIATGLAVCIFGGCALFVCTHPKPLPPERVKTAEELEFEEKKKREEKARKEEEEREHAKEWRKGYNGDMSDFIERYGFPP